MLTASRTAFPPVFYCCKLCSFFWSCLFLPPCLGCLCFAPCLYECQRGMSLGLLQRTAPCNQFLKFVHSPWFTIDTLSQKSFKHQCLGKIGLTGYCLIPPLRPPPPPPNLASTLSPFSAVSCRACCPPAAAIRFVGFYFRARVRVLSAVTVFFFSFLFFLWVPLVKQQTQ